MIADSFPGSIKYALSKAISDFGATEEIRIRCGKPIVLCGIGKNIYITANGKLTNNTEDAIVISEKLINDTVKIITQNSVYALQDEIKNGYITLCDGTRVGICGKCVTKSGKVEYIKDIISLNFRLAKNHPEFGVEFYSTLKNDLKNVLIISPPGFGKTTLLRNLIRFASNDGHNVSVLDERCEIAPVVNGIGIFDLGENTDILSGTSKDIGINMLIRSMNPRIVATDEISTVNDFRAIYNASKAGVNVFATFHGNTKEDYLSKCKSVLGTSDIFEHFVYIKLNKKFIREIEWE